MSADHRSAVGPMPVSRIIVDGYGGEFGPGTQFRVSRVTLQEGLDIVRWQSTFEQPLELQLHDDSERIHFSFTTRLKGKAACSFVVGRRQRHYPIHEGTGNISFGNDHHGCYHQHGDMDNITVMVSPEVLSNWDLEIDSDLHKALACDHCFLEGHRGGELSATAHLLSCAMDQGTSDSAAQPRSSLWLYAQGLTLVSLFLEARRDVGCTCHVSRVDRQRLVRARERLLLDLGKAPSLAELAREVGMSQPKLIRGFRQLFYNSVYGVFQQARMSQARNRLLIGDESVMRIASELGYANASHFATAFRKQFGVNPSTLKSDRRIKPLSAG